MSSAKILVTGSLAFDLIMDFPGSFSENIDPTKLHLINLSFLVNNLKKEKGGTAGNIAYSLALLQIPVAILGAVGDDFDGYISFLETAGVEISTIKKIENESTSQAFIITDQKDNQITAFYPGAMNDNPNLKIANLKEKPNFVVVSPNHPEAMMNFVKEAQELNIPYMFDPGMQLPRLSEEDLKTGINGAKILIGNDYEMGLLKSKLSLTDEQLLEQVEILITTLGEKGSEIKTKTEFITIEPGKPEQVVDPTGAGDAYRSGFLTGLQQGFDLQTCGQMGAIASCYAIEKYGTTNHRYSVSEFCKRYQDNFKKELQLKEVLI